MIPADADSISKQYEILLDELRRYNPEMLDKDRLLAVTKCDMLDEELQSELSTELQNTLTQDYVFISSVANQGLIQLKDKLWTLLNKPSAV